MPMVGHHLQLPLSLNAQSVGTLLLWFSIDINELILLINENTVPVFLSPHAHAEGVIFCASDTVPTPVSLQYYECHQA
jgi:hypothetical protein